MATRYQSTAMKLLRAIILLFLFVGVAFAQTGAPPFPPNPTVGEEVTGPNGAVYRWDGTKWVAGIAPFVPPDGSTWTATGLQGVASLGVNGAVTVGGNLDVSGITSHASIVTPTLAVTGNLQIATGANLLFAGFPMGGTCPAGEFVNALSAVGQLTCVPVVSGGGVFVGVNPPASPAAGQLWFNSTDLQTYMWYTDPTSSQWVPVVNLGGSSGGGAFLPLAGGTMTGPINNVTALGVGAAASATAGVLITGVSTGNYDTQISLTNANNGANAASTLFLSNDQTLHYGIVRLTSSGYTAAGPNVPGDSMWIGTGAANGMVISTATAAPVNFFINGNLVTQVGPLGLTIAGAHTTANPLTYSLGVGQPIPSDNGWPQAFMNGFANVNATGFSGYGLDAGAYYDNTGLGWKVTDPNGDVYHFGANAQAHDVFWYIANGLPVGSHWNGSPVSQYMSLRDNLGGGGAGLYLGFGAFKPTVNPVTQWQFDRTSGPDVSVPQGQCVNFGMQGSGLAITTGTNGAWNTCAWVLGSSSATVIGGDTGWCESNTSTPAAQRYSIAFIPAVGYAICNNTGINPATFGMMLFRTRDQP